MYNAHGDSAGTGEVKNRDRGPFERLDPFKELFLRLRGGLSRIQRTRSFVNSPPNLAVLCQVFHTCKS